MVVADTGALYALVDASDAWHDRVVEWWKRSVEQVVVPVTVLPELCYLLQRRIGPAAEQRFIRAVVEGEFEVEQLAGEDFERVADLMASYVDLPLGFVDASVMAIAERYEARDVLTTDRRHFGVVRPIHTKRFVLLP